MKHLDTIKLLVWDILKSESEIDISHLISDLESVVYDLIVKYKEENPKAYDTNSLKVLLKNQMLSMLIFLNQDRMATRQIRSRASAEENLNFQHLETDRRRLKQCLDEACETLQTMAEMLGGQEDPIDNFEDLFTENEANSNRI